MIMHHIVHCIDCVPFCVAGICPLSIDVIPDDVIVDTDEDSMLSSEVPGKQNPLVHSDTSYSLALLSFTALGQQRVICYLLR